MHVLCAGRCGLEILLRPWSNNESRTHLWPMCLCIVSVCVLHKQGAHMELGVSVGLSNVQSSEIVFVPLVCVTIT